MNERTEQHVREQIESETEAMKAEGFKKVRLGGELNIQPPFGEDHFIEAIGLTAEEDGGHGFIIWQGRNLQPIRTRLTPGQTLRMMREIREHPKILRQRSEFDRFHKRQTQPRAAIQEIPRQEIPRQEIPRRNPEPSIPELLQLAKSLGFRTRQWEGENRTITTILTPKPSDHRQGDEEEHSGRPLIAMRIPHGQEKTDRMVFRQLNGQQKQILPIPQNLQSKTLQQFIELGSNLEDDPEGESKIASQMKEFIQTHTRARAGIQRINS